MQDALPTPSRIYRRRQPEKTVLYRALSQSFETFLQVYEERFQPTFGHFRKAIQDAVYKSLDYRRLLGDLVACSWRAVRLYFRIYFERGDIVPGAIGFISTAGELLNFHPHIHILLTDGGFLPDGTFRHMPYFDSDKVEELFRAEVLRLLLKKQLITEQTVNSMLSWRHRGFSANATVRVDTIKDAVQLGRYMIRCPIVLKRLQWDEHSGEVVYAARPSRAKGPFGGVVRCGVLEFIARVTDHIPEPGQQLIRNWGYYANASRGNRRRNSELECPHEPEGTDIEEQDVDGWRRRRKLTWAKLIQKVYEVDPLLCRFCGAEMKIISFITEYPVIKKILKHLNLESQQPEPLAHSPPLFQDTVYVPF